MSETIHTVPKSLVEAPGHDAESKAWGLITRAQNVNADMIVRTEHTMSEFVFVVDPDLAVPQ